MAYECVNDMHIQLDMCLYARCTAAFRITVPNTPLRSFRCLEIVHGLPRSTLSSNTGSQTISIWVESAQTDIRRGGLVELPNLDVTGLLRKLPLHFSRLRDEQCARPLERVGGVGLVVRLDLDLDIVLQWMRDFVAREKHRRIQQQLSAGQSVVAEHANA